MILKNYTLIGLSALSLLFSCQQGSGPQSSDVSASNRMIANKLVDIPVDQVDCMFNNTTVVDGTSVTAYQNSSVAYGESCVSETRTCTTGALSGSFQYASCSAGAAASCLFNGATIAHGDSVTAYSTSNVAYGSVCSGVAETRTCNNGVLSGSAQYGSCAVAAPRACLFDGKTIEHGGTAVAFETSTVSFGLTCKQENRTCNDGTLTGSFQYGSCATDQAASCLFDGRTIAHGESVAAFATSSVAYGSTCTQESRTCNNGVLSGNYSFSSCTTGQPQNCSFNGVTVNHNESIIAFAAEHVAYGQSCASESRSCVNGALSGSMTASSCVVDAAPPAKSCTLNGKEIADGSSVTVFTSSSVASGQTCQTETRSCSNGVLSGSATFESCVVNPPVDTGGGNNGGGSTGGDTGGGSGGGNTGGGSTGNQCTNSNLIWEFPDVCRGNCGKGVGYFKSRISRDGGKTWLVLFKNRLPDDIEQMWNYMMSKNGKNSCDRPNVQYTASPNRGYIRLANSAVPDCNVCKFVEVEETKRGHGWCQKEKKTKKVIKFLCGDIKKKKSHHDNGHHYGWDKDDDDDKDHDKGHDRDDDHGKSQKDNDKGNSGKDQKDNSSSSKKK